MTKIILKKIPKTLAIDFDGVIHRYSRGYQDGKIYDRPMERARETIEELANAGFRVIVFSTRDPKQIKKWLIKNRFVGIIKVTNKKPIAMAYIDDRAIRFTKWEDIKRYFL